MQIGTAAHEILVLPDREPVDVEALQAPAPAHEIDIPVEIDVPVATNAAE